MIQLLPVLALVAVDVGRAADDPWAEAFAEVTDVLALADVRLVLLPDGGVALEGPGGRVVVPPPADDTVEARVETLYVAVARLRAPASRVQLSELVRTPAAPEPAPAVLPTTPVAAPVPAPVVVPEPAPPPPDPVVIVASAPPEPTAATLPRPADPELPAREWSVGVLLGVAGNGPTAAVQLGRRHGLVAVTVSGGVTGQGALAGRVSDVPVAVTALDGTLAAHLVHPDLPLRAAASLGLSERWYFSDGRPVADGVVPVVGAWLGADLRRTRFVLRPEVGVTRDLRETWVQPGAAAPRVVPRTQGVARLGIGIVR